MNEWMEHLRNDIKHLGLGSSIEVLDDYTIRANLKTETTKQKYRVYFNCIDPLGNPEFIFESVLFGSPSLNDLNNDPHRAHKLKLFYDSLLRIHD